MRTDIRAHEAHSYAMLSMAYMHIHYGAPDEYLLGTTLLANKNVYAKSWFLEGTLL